MRAINDDESHARKRRRKAELLKHIPGFVLSADVMMNYQWYFIPVAFFIALVMAFVFVGDGLRDAADPYAEVNK